jgi:hypothetical protein
MMYPMMRKLTPAVLLFAVVTVAVPAIGQQTPAPTQPTSAPTRPATAPTSRPRRALQIPPGFEQVSIGGIVAICDSADKPWVTDLLKAYQPATMPTTMPADLLARVRSQLPAAVAHMGKDLALQDTAPVQKRIEDQLLPHLKALQNFHPPVFYMIASKARIKELLKSGKWEDPTFHYNRATDEVTMRENVSLTLDAAMDDSILAAIYDASDAPGQRNARVIDVIGNSQVQMQQMISGRAMFATQMVFAEAAMAEVFGPMKLPPSQLWFATGLAGALSCDYAEAIIGSPRKELLLLTAAELRRNPIKPATIDLLDPADPATIKRQYLAFYSDAYRRKCVAVAAKLVDKSRDSLPKLISSLREKPCATGQDLLARIKETTGVDLTQDTAVQK